VRPTGASREGADGLSARRGRPAARAGGLSTRWALLVARAGGLSTRWALLVALAGGLALAAAFPPVGAWPLAAAAPALLTVALWRSSARFSLVIGLVFGAAFFVPLLAWLVNVAWYVWTALAVTETVLFAAAVLGQRLLLRLRAWPVAVAGWWVAAEAVRDRWPWGGFPWGRLAMSQAGAPTAGWVAVGGPPLLTFLLALAGACLAWRLLVPSPQWRRGLMAWLVFVAAAGIALAGGLLPAAGQAAGTGAARQAAGTPTAIVAAVQGNVPRSRNLPDLLRATTVTSNHAAATEQLARQVGSGQRPAPDLVIWPENSTDIDPRTSPPTYQAIQAAVDAIGRPVLVGAVLDHPVRNSGQLWLPGRGPVQTYIKRQLVPFGEIIPFRGVLSKFISLIKLQPVDFSPGHRAVVFRIGKIRLGDVICYEVGFDNLVSSEVAAGANLLTVQTNDADFELDGQTGETLQQLAMARIRAMEHDRAVVVVSTTGVSAIIAPDGTVIASSHTWRRTVLEARVPLRTDITLADRAGGWPEAAISAATLAALAWALTGAVRARRRAADAQRTHSGRDVAAAAADAQ
jgi:apolipoprotein N-acyltransferase